LADFSLSLPRQQENAESRAKFDRRKHGIQPFHHQAEPAKLSMSRLEKIREMLEREPHDVFLRYALAMELDSAGNVGESRQIFAELMRGDPPHLPSFFRTAQIQARLGEHSQAAQTLTEGIRLAHQQGDSHTAMEMTQMLETQQAAEQDP
jgi:hypothetical protein